MDANEPAYGKPNKTSAGVVEPSDVGTQIHQIEHLVDNTLTQTERRISQDSSEHKHAGNHLEEDDWTTEETTSTVDRDDFEADGSRKLTDEPHGDNLTSTAALVAQDIQTPTIENAHWKTVRNNVNGMIAAESLLNEVRANQTEQLYETNWSAAASSKLPDSSIVGDDVDKDKLDAYAVNTAANTDHGEPSSRPSDSPPGAFNVDKVEGGRDVPENSADDAHNNYHAMVSDNNAKTASDADDV